MSFNKTTNLSDDKAPPNSLDEYSSSSKSSTTPSQTKDKKEKSTPISYSADRVIAAGSFGIVFQATVVGTGEIVAIKKVLQDHRYKNRELEIMQMLYHTNIIPLKHCFYSTEAKKADIFLNVVMEYMPQTIHRTIRNHTKTKRKVPLILVKTYMFQLLRACAYIHSLRICHRDIKPHNILVNPETHVLKLCDFGSAKILQANKPNVSYICSRFYRAPELVLQSSQYTTAVDIWSVGCVMGEMLRGSPLFPGNSGTTQLVEIISALGTPSASDLQQINPQSNLQATQLPQCSRKPWTELLGNNVSQEACDLLSRLLTYSPSQRPDALSALSHPFFNEIRATGCVLPESKALPNSVFNFSRNEFRLLDKYNLTNSVVPQHVLETRNKEMSKTDVHMIQSTSVS